MYTYQVLLLALLPEQVLTIVPHLGINEAVWLALVLLVFGEALGKISGGGGENILISSSGPWVK